MQIVAFPSYLAMKYESKLKNEVPELWKIRNAEVLKEQIFILEEKYLVSALRSKLYSTKNLFKIRIKEALHVFPNVTKLRPKTMFYKNYEHVLSKLIIKQIENVKNIYESLTERMKKCHSSIYKSW